MGFTLFLARYRERPGIVLNLLQYRPGLFFCSVGKEKSMSGNIEHERLLRVRDVLKRVPVSRSTWFAWVADGKAPAPVKFGSRCTCWKESEISDFISSK